jgi:cytidylate kinase
MTTRHRNRVTRNRTERNETTTSDDLTDRKAEMINTGDHHGNRPVPNSHPHRHAIAIDGPAAAGKSTVARALADRLGAIYLDTGLLYRAVTLAVLNAGIPLDDGPRQAELSRSLDLRIVAPFRPGETERVLLAGEDVTNQLRSPAVNRHVSQVSAHPEVRATLLPRQRALAEGNKVVMVGRDIASVVIPDAGVKLFLDASPEERARRRLLEMPPGTSYEDVLADIRRRDLADSSRETAPLMAAEGVQVIRTDGRPVEEIIAEIAGLAESLWQESGCRS